MPEVPLESEEKTTYIIRKKARILIGLSSSESITESAVANLKLQSSQYCEETKALDRLLIKFLLV